MFCKNCGSPLRDDDVFCQNCGMKIEDEDRDSEIGTQNPNNKKGIVYFGVGMIMIIVLAFFVLGGYYRMSGGNLKKTRTDAIVDANSDEFTSRTTKSGKTDSSPTPTATVSATATPVPTVSATPTPTPMETSVFEIPIPTVMETQVPETPIPTEIPVQSEYILPESGSTYLTREQVDELTLYEMCLARNEIYARHGRMFKKENLQQYFSSQPWYTPMYSPEEFSESVFNDYEKENIKLIKSVEEDYNSPYL
ncbi:MAG: YARHG domain-containing protein [Lachnospiraceae bacterium]